MNLQQKIKSLLLLIVFLSIQAGVKAQVSFGRTEKINDQWKFKLGDEKNAETVGYDAGKWRLVNLPHDWSIKGVLSPDQAACTGYLPGGIGWYRKSLNIPTDKKGEKVYLYFEGIYNRSEVFINGHSIGKRPNGYISFMYDATPYIEFGKENTIAVRVDHSQSADSRWYTGSGIYRDVWLVYSDQVHIAQWGVYAYSSKITKNEGVLSVSIELENGSEKTANLSVQTELQAPDGKIIAKSTQKVTVQSKKNEKCAFELKVKNPKLWSLETPSLYNLRTIVLKDGKEIDRTSTITGFRTLTFDPNKGFALNGEWVKVKGVCIHHDAGVLGSAVPRDVWKRRLLTLKEIGCNAIRTSHNPQTPDLYAMCDELGLLVMDEASDEWEFPKRKWIEGWNVGTPGFQGSFDFFKEWGEQDIADLVRRDRNHVSIFAWSIGNEVDYPNDPYSHPILDGSPSTSGFTQAIFGGYKKDAPKAERLGDIAKRMATVVRKYDQSRPVTAGLAGVAMSNETEYPFVLDITGYNYTENRYDSDHKKYPNRVIFGSENRHDLSAWKSVKDNEHVFGQFLWTGIDYLGESGRWPSRGFYSGLLDFGGFIKPRGYFRQSLWTMQPMAYLGTYPTPGQNSRSQLQDAWSQMEANNEKKYVEKVPSMDAWSVWNYEQSQSVRVVCYTNTAKAQLLLNGKEVGETKNYDERTGIIYWDIPYQNGRLEVIGMDAGGKEQVRYAVQSSKQPYALSVQADQTSLDKNKGLTHIVVQVVDENGVPVMLADNEVTCRIEGPAKLLGLEGSNNSDMSDYGDNTHRTYHGRLLAYIQSTGESGTVKIKFSSPWLKEAEISFNISN